MQCKSSKKLFGRLSDLLENCKFPRKCACSSNDFHNLTAVILETKSDQSEEPVGPTLTNHHPA